MNEVDVQKPMKTQDIVDHVFAIAPNPDHAWENVYLTGNGESTLTGVAVGWWLTLEMIKDMVDRGLNLGLSHERVVFELPQRWVWGQLPATEGLPGNQELRALTEAHNISIHQFHSNIDKADWGMPVALLARLGWDQWPVDWSRGVPVVDLPQRPLNELIKELKKKLDIPFVRYDGDLQRQISRVAIPWGGLCQSFGGPATVQPLDVDVIIGGDIIDGVVRMARTHGWAVIDAMHHATEVDAMVLLARKLQTAFPETPVVYYPTNSPWQVL